MTVLVDSDILIHVSRGREPEILRRWTLLGESGDPILCSPVTVAEVWSGVRKHESALVEDLLGALICVPAGEETARLAAQYLREFRKTHGVEVPDALIAAAASLAGAALWTCNRKHYPMKDVTFF